MEIPRISSKRTDLIKSLESIIKLDKFSKIFLLNLFFTIKRALSLTNSKTEKLFVLQYAALTVSDHVIIPQESQKHWSDFKKTLLISFGIHDTLDEVKSKLDNIKMGHQSLEQYYEAVCKLVLDATVLQYLKRHWEDLMLVQLHVEKKGIKAFIEGMSTEYATYLMMKKPKNLDEAYEYAKRRFETDQNTSAQFDLNREAAALSERIKALELEKSMLESKFLNQVQISLCPTLLIKTNFPTEHKHIFLVWKESPANFIKANSLPPGTPFTWDKTIFSGSFGQIETMGHLNIGLDFDTYSIRDVKFYVLPESSTIEDDGIVQLKYGDVQKTENGYFFTHSITCDSMQIVMGLDCPKKGNCRHFPDKCMTNSNPFSSKLLCLK